MFVDCLNVVVGMCLNGLNVVVKWNIVFNE